MPENEQTSDPAQVKQKLALHDEALRLVGSDQLVRSAAKWIREAMDAWTEDDHQKVAMLAPLAVEHLGKAVLWKKHPALLVPLEKGAEASLIVLVKAPRLSDPKLKTVGLRLLLSRIDAAIAPLPLDKPRRDRMVDIRNGAVHVAASATSRHVLIDSLTVCTFLLEQLAQSDWDLCKFYGEHQANVTKLLEQGGSEIQQRVMVKIARARKGLEDLEDRVGEALFEEMVERLEEEAAEAIDLENHWAVNRVCPVCEREGRLAGVIDMDPHMEYDDPDENGLTEAYTYGWDITLSPTDFTCHVCRLRLHGVQELAVAGLPSDAIAVDEYDLGPDFDPDQEAERLASKDVDVNDALTALLGEAHHSD
ncbi:hypothetical protein [Nocardia farcinica]|uniref:hypothetical protein n=1 Tax=Nocardia farcinica TaxID=37329 RepID=UPI002456523B|nr:hypothetical protein [Nocardia farcinica]